MRAPSLFRRGCHDDGRCYKGNRERPGKPMTCSGTPTDPVRGVRATGPGVAERLVPVLMTRVMPVEGKGPWFKRKRLERVSEGAGDWENLSIRKRFRRCRTLHLPKRREKPGLSTSMRVRQGYREE